MGDLPLNAFGLLIWKLINSRIFARACRLNSFQSCFLFFFSVIYLNPLIHCLMYWKVSLSVKYLNPLIHYLMYWKLSFNLVCWALFGDYLAVLGVLWLLLALFGRFLALFGRFWAPLGAFGRLWALFGRSWTLFGSFRALCGPLISLFGRSLGTVWRPL